MTKSDGGLFKSEHIAAVSTGGLHILAVILIIAFAKPEAKPPLKKELAVPVALVTQQSPQTPPEANSAQPTFERKRRRKKVRKVPSKRKRHRKRTSPPETMAPQKTDDTLDCSMFDDASCSPCLADAVTCKKCCGKKDTIGTSAPSSAQMKPDAGTPCSGQGCVKGDPCTPEALSRMSTSFCPRVRQAVYSKVGTTVLRGIGKGTYLAARIAIAVSPSGSLSLASMLKSSGNGQFDGAVRSAVSSAPKVLPPANLSACVTSRGCVFSVTIGAKKINATKSTVKINTTTMGTPAVPPKGTMSGAPANKTGSP